MACACHTHTRARARRERPLFACVQQHAHSTHGWIRAVQCSATVVAGRRTGPGRRLFVRLVSRPSTEPAGVDVLLLPRPSSSPDLIQFQQYGVYVRVRRSGGLRLRVRVTTHMQGRACSIDILLSPSGCVHELLKRNETKQNETGRGTGDSHSVGEATGKPSACGLIEPDMYSRTGRGVVSCVEGGWTY